MDPLQKSNKTNLEHRLELFDNAQSHLHTLVLNGYGFAIVKPIENLDDSDIEYRDSYFDTCKFTDEPLIPYNSDMENDSDDDDVYDATTDEEIEVEEEFIAEEWTYDGVTYLLDTSTNYLYFPSTLNLLEKKQVNSLSTLMLKLTLDVRGTHLLFSIIFILLESFSPLFLMKIENIFFSEINDYTIYSREINSMEELIKHDISNLLYSISINYDIDLEILRDRYLPILNIEKKI